MNLKNFRTYNLAIDFCKLLNSLKVTGPLKNQLTRASTSIALNLAEGNGRQTTKDKIKFYYIAQGSLRECESILTILEVKDQAILQKLDNLGACLYKLIKYLHSN